MKRVLVLNQFALPRDQSGGTRHIDLFGRAHGWSPIIIAGNRNHYSQQQFATADQRFHLVTVPTQSGGGAQRLRGWLRYSLGALKWGLSNRPDAVYASSPHLLAPLVGWIIARRHKVGFVLEVRDLWPESMVAAGVLREGSLLHRALSALERFLVHRADEIVVVTTGWEDHFRALGADLNHYTVITNGAEPDDFTVDVPRDELRERFNIHGLTAVFAGAHGPKDGIELILDAAVMVPEIDIVLVGDGPVKSAAMSRVADDRITNVRFLDPVPKETLRELLAACDIGIHAVSPLPVFRLGMSPNKLFDYLAAGLPVVSNAGAPIRDLLAGPTCGWVGDADALAEGLSTVRDLPSAERTIWAEAGIEQVRTKFSRTRAAALTTKILDRSAASRPARQS